MAEPIVMQFGVYMLHGGADAPTDPLGTFEGVWPIEKHYKA